MIQAESITTMFDGTVTGREGAFEAGNIESDAVKGGIGERDTARVDPDIVVIVGLGDDKGGADKGR